MTDSRQLLLKDALEIETVAQDAPPNDVADGKGEQVLARGIVAAMDLKAEEIGDFDEYLAAIIQE